MFQRFKCGGCIQKEGQTVEEFVTELKTLASTFEFKKENNMIRDRIGFRDMETKNKLSSLLSMESLTLDKAESLCRTREVTDKELREMTNEAVNVHIIIWAVN